MKPTKPAFGLYCTASDTLNTVGTIRQVQRVQKHHTALGRTCCVVVTLDEFRKVLCPRKRATS